MYVYTVHRNGKAMKYFWRVLPEEDKKYSSAARTLTSSVSAHNQPTRLLPVHYFIIHVLITGWEPQYKFTLKG